MNGAPVLSAEISYAEGGPSLRVRHIYTWDRDKMPPPVMSASSGPKDYIKNQICTLFDAHPEVDRVVMVRASGPPFLLMRSEAKYWFDVSGKQVISTSWAKEIAL
jgi:hypothetical protein